jgi:hypothetical protein
MKYLKCLPSFFGSETYNLQKEMMAIRLLQIQMVTFFCLVYRFSQHTHLYYFIPFTIVTNFVAYLLEVNPDLLNKVLTTRVMETQRGGRRGM